MRKIRLGSRISRARLERREQYSTYIVSAAWYRRRDEWAEAELIQCGDSGIQCRGCGKKWKCRRDDLHHATYDRLGEEAHDDLWPLCRSCHTAIHDLVDSTKAWRKLDKFHANKLALVLLQHTHSPSDARSVGPAESLRAYL